MLGGDRLFIDLAYTNIYGVIRTTLQSHNLLTLCRFKKQN